MLPRFNSDGIGKKGGTSATSGKTSVRYRVVMPDDHTLMKRSFSVYANPMAACYCHQGKWYIAGIVPADDIPSWAQAKTLIRAELML